MGRCPGALEVAGENAPGPGPPLGLRAGWGRRGPALWPGEGQAGRDAAGAGGALLFLTAAGGHGASRGALAPPPRPTPSPLPALPPPAAAQSKCGSRGRGSGWGRQERELCAVPTGVGGSQCSVPGPPDGGSGLGVRLELRIPVPGAGMLISCLHEGAGGAEMKLVAASVGRRGLWVMGHTGTPSSDPSPN